MDFLLFSFVGLYLDDLSYTGFIGYIKGDYYDKFYQGHCCLYAYLFDYQLHLASQCRLLHGRFTRYAHFDAIHRIAVS